MDAFGLRKLDITEQRVGMNWFTIIILHCTASLYLSLTFIDENPKTNAMDPLALELAEMTSDTTGETTGAEVRALVAIHEEESLYPTLPAVRGADTEETMSFHSQLSTSHPLGSIGEGVPSEFPRSSQGSGASTESLIPSRPQWPGCKGLGLSHCGKPVKEGETLCADDLSYRAEGQPKDKCKYGTEHPCEGASIPGGEGDQVSEAVSPDGSCSWCEMLLNENHTCLSCFHDGDPEDEVYQRQNYRCRTCYDQWNSSVGQATCSSQTT